MPSLRVHVKEDSTLGAVSQANLELAADVLEWVAGLSRHPVLRLLCPFRRHSQTLPLLSATFARVRGIPEPLMDRAPIVPVVVETPAERADLPSHEDFLKARAQELAAKAKVMPPQAKVMPPHLPIQVPMVRLCDESDMEPLYAFFNADRG